MAIRCHRFSIHNIIQHLTAHSLNSIGTENIYESKHSCRSFFIEMPFGTFFLVGKQQKQQKQQQRHKDRQTNKKNSFINRLESPFHIWLTLTIKCTEHQFERTRRHKTNKLKLITRQANGASHWKELTWSWPESARTWRQKRSNTRDTICSRGEGGRRGNCESMLTHV